MLIFFSDWNKRIELNRIVSGFIDRVLWQNRPIDSFFPELLDVSLVFQGFRLQHMLVLSAEIKNSHRPFSINYWGEA